MKKEQIQKGLFSNKDLYGLIIPLILELALKLIVGLIDSIMVSSVGEAAVSGVSLVDSVMQLLIYVFAALASGGAIVAGQYLGAKNEKEAGRAAGELMWLNVLLSVGIFLVMLLSGDWILNHVFGTIAEDVYANARQYFYIVILTIPAIGMFEAGTSIFRTMNDAKTTMKVSILMNLLNGMGNALFIYGCGLGTAGAALGTLISRWMAAAIITILLLNPERKLHIEKNWKHRFDLKLSKSILAMGIPNGVENGIFQLGKIMILGLVGIFGTSAITANAVTQTMASMEMIPGNAVQLAIVTIIARCVGAKEYEQAEYYNRKLLKISYLAGLIWSGVLLVSLPGILNLYHLSEETASLTVSMFLWHMAGAVLIWPLSFDLPASLRAAGDVKFPMVVSICSMWILRFGGAYLMAVVCKLGAAGIWIAMAIGDWGFRAVMYCIRWHSGKWKQAQIV